MMCCAQKTSKRQSEASPPVKQPLITGTAGAATQPGTDNDVKEAAQTPSVHDDPPTGREVKRKLPDLPFQHKYGSGENYYVRECYEKYYPLVEQFVLTGDKLTVTGASEIGTSVFYAYCFEAFCKAHRDEWIVVAVSYDKNGEATELAVYEDGVETTRVTYADEETILTVLRDLQRQLGKMAGYQDGKGEETKEKIKKILLLCDGVPKTRRPNMVVFTSPNEEWFRKNKTDGKFFLCRCGRLVSYKRRRWYWISVWMVMRLTVVWRFSAEQRASACLVTPAR
ncbi:hypothetical protein PF010_g28578 [Phytophthora fragariae]|uniref:Uncharacterized protein n=1 Tax=Phytophthora fragariae TaxID=53985 RepID=A0A6G0JQP8_9STRA|nr:hypothetical protein PF010_g28578 [Phytophthora fragariae]